jgi:hypothetical protein
VDVAVGVEVGVAVGVEVGVAVGVKVRVGEGEKTIKVTVGVDVRVFCETNPKIGERLESPPSRDPKKPFKEPSQKRNPTKKSTLRISPKLIKKIFLLISPY